MLNTFPVELEHACVKKKEKRKRTSAITVPKLTTFLCKASQTILQTLISPTNALNVATDNLVRSNEQHACITPEFWNLRTVHYLEGLTMAAKVKW
jgi:RNA-binding protein YlmH